MGGQLIEVELENKRLLLQVVIPKCCRMDFSDESDPFVFNNNHIVNSNGLRNGYLDSGNQGGYAALGGKADNDAGNPGRRQDPQTQDRLHDAALLPVR